MGLLFRRLQLVWRDGLAGIERQHVCHSRHELATDRGNTPLAMPPWLLLVLLRSARMVSGESFSTKPNSTALSANKHSVHWSRPSGTALQAMAMRYACWEPVRLWR